MFAKSTIAAVALILSLGAAQSNSTIDPDSVSITLRNQWCSAQMTTCSTLCGGSFAPDVLDPNDCFPNNLTYICSCSNGSEPGLQYYTTSLPTFICEAVFAACDLAGTGQKATQDKCKANEQANCGHLDIDDFTGDTSSSSSAAPTATSAGGDSNPTATATTSTSSGAAATMMALGGEYGTGMVAAGVAAAFGLLL